MLNRVGAFPRKRGSREGKPCIYRSFRRLKYNDVGIVLSFYLLEEILKFVCHLLVGIICPTNLLQLG